MAAEGAALILSGKVEGISLDALGFVEFTSKVNHKLFSHGVWARTNGLCASQVCAPRSYTLAPAGVCFVGKRFSPGQRQGKWRADTSVSNVQLQGLDCGI